MALITATSPDLEYDRKIMKSWCNLYTELFPGPTGLLSKYFNYSSKEISTFTGNIKQNSITIDFFRI